jgi:integrase
MKKATTWQKVGPNMYRHPNGVYYARFDSGGKDVWRTLKTKLKSVAKPKLAELLKKEGERRENGVAEASGKLTATQARDRIMAELEASRAKPATVAYWKEIYRALFREWPELPDLELRKVTAKQCEDWAKRYRAKASPTRFNGALQRLRRLFTHAIDEGHRYADPTAKITQERVVTRVPELPSRAKFEEWLQAIRDLKHRYSKHAADLAEFLAVTGLRIDKEANQILWRHVDFEAEEIIIADSKSEAGIRRVPMNGRCKTLLCRMRGERPDEGPEEKVLAVSRGKRTWDKAAKAVGIAPMRNHDLRHYYCTACVESGVDFPTLAKWLGHADGGHLLSKTYAHVRNEHSKRMASKVTFGREEAAADGDSL